MTHIEMIYNFDTIYLTSRQNISTHYRVHQKCICILQLHSPLGGSIINKQNLSNKMYIKHWVIRIKMHSCERVHSDLFCSYIQYNVFKRNDTIEPRCYVDDDGNQPLDNLIGSRVHPQISVVRVGVLSEDVCHVIRSQAVPVRREIGAIRIQPGVNLDISLMSFGNQDLQGVPQRRRCGALSTRQVPTCER